MTKATLNPSYPPLSTLTAIIVHRAVKAMLDKAYSRQGEGLSLDDYVREAFENHEWEPDTDGPCLQVMRELEFVGLARQTTPLVLIVQPKPI